MSINAPTLPCANGGKIVRGSALRRLLDVTATQGLAGDHFGQPQAQNQNCAQDQKLDVEEVARIRRQVQPHASSCLHHVHLCIWRRLSV